MEIIRTVIDCPAPLELIEKQLDNEAISLDLGQRGRLSVYIDGHEEIGDGQYAFFGHVVDTGTRFELTCWHYGLGTDGTITFDDDLPDPHLELAEAYSEQ